MKQILAAASVAALMAVAPARAEIGGVELQVEDAQTDVAKPLNQVNNFIASGVNATIADEQPALWQRSNAPDLTTNWITSGRPIGAILAPKASGAAMENVVVAATADRLAAMQAGDLDVTVFQNAAGQAAPAIDSALAGAKGKAVQAGHGAL